MKNKFLSSPLFTLLLSACLLLGGASASIAKTKSLKKINVTMTGTVPYWINGSQAIQNVDMYQVVDTEANDDYSFNFFEKNRLYVLVDDTLTIPTNFLIPQLIDQGPGCSWSFDQTKWSATILEGANCLSAPTYNEYTDTTPLLHHVTALKYDILAEGKVVLKISSDPTSSDFTRYTMTMNIHDNLAPSATDTTSSQSYNLQGGPQVLSVPLYATDELGVPIKDAAGQYQFTQFSVDLGSSIYSFSKFPQPTGTTGIQWTGSETSWKLSLLDQTDSCINYDNFSTSSFTSGVSTLTSSFTTTKPGTSQVRVTSEKNPSFLGTIEDGSDEVAYTMTIVVVDNSPKPDPTTDETHDSSQPAPVTN
ncbi:MAG: hypothetical protein K2W99_05290 [Chthoniobacterales bacterium]|nr:hypothetical protein [Chthoniobacterales bacterium]